MTIADGRATALYRAVTALTKEPGGPTLAEVGRALRSLTPGELEQAESIAAELAEQRVSRSAAGEVLEMAAGESDGAEEVLMDLVRQFTPGMDETPSGAAADLSEQEQPSEDRPKKLFGLEEFLQVAQEDDAPVDPDVAFKDELLRQSHAEHFGEDSELSDDEMWAEYERVVGGQE
jgi:hypothetical protein